MYHFLGVLLTVYIFWIYSLLTKWESFVTLRNSSGSYIGWLPDGTLICKNRNTAASPPAVFNTLDRGFPGNEDRLFFYVLKIFFKLRGSIIPWRRV